MRNKASLDVLMPMFKAMFEHSLDNVVIVNMQAKMVYINPVLVKTLNIAEDTEQKFAAILKEEPTASYVAAISQIIATGESCSALITMKSSEYSRVIYDLIHLSAIKDDDGNMIGVLSIGRDLGFYQEQQNQDIKKRESYLRALLDTFPFIVWMKDKEGRFLATNQKFAEVAGVYATKELEGKTDFDFFPPELAQGYVTDDMEVFNSGNPKQVEEKIQKRDGTLYWAETYKSPVSVDGKIIGTVGFAHDISEKKTLLSTITERELEYSNLVENIPLTIVRYDLNCIRIFVSLGVLNCQDLSLNDEYSYDNYLGKTPEELWSPHIKNFTGSEFQAVLKEVIKTGNSKKVELHIELENLKLVNLITIAPAYDENKNIIGGLTIANDISEIVQYRQRLEHLAYHDPLTNLPNRAFLNESLKKTLAHYSSHQGQVSLMFLDLDYFKSINDTLGHEVGDQLLIQASERILSCLRDGDVLARIGGDEFAILIHDVNDNELSQMANRIADKLSASFDMENMTFFVTVSIGIASYPKDTNNIDSLMKYADTAMYHAKKNGRDNFQFYVPELTSVVSERLSIETALRRAVDRQELSLVFQPKIDMRNGRVLGAEALLRWDSLDIGQIEPNKFIGIAEESGMIVEIGKWVLHHACSFAYKINEGRSDPIKIAVNLSSRQFIRNDIYDALRSIFLSNQCHPSWIELEITESLLLQDSEEVLSVLNCIDSMGVQFAIDDFGTGYSALAYLNKFPIRQVKIDRSFVHEIETDKNAALLIKAIIAMATSLDKEVIAEGIETQGQANLLQSYGCHQGQGFLLGRPMAYEQFYALVNSPKR